MISSRALVLVIVVSCWATSPAAARESVFLEDLTWTEVRDALRAGRTTGVTMPGLGVYLALARREA